MEPEAGVGAIWVRQAWPPLPAPLALPARGHVAMIATQSAVVTHQFGRPGSTCPHERGKYAALARLLAELRGATYAGAWQPERRQQQPNYFVPYSTVVGLDAAREAGIRSARDLFGAVVPWEFVATKAITHGLVRPDAARPTGWSARFGDEVAPAVLPGSTAFCRADLRQAGARLLNEG